ncbi:hypothetical protein [Kitasatospora azatica]|uniref:hypothetical protein n=1 Tax=Kitasatospora azatica TaxID=58347 RepID=UPI000AD99071|nr:hypothetical protein [Kitasatospora azatica]
MAALERKIRAAGRPWTIGDIAMVSHCQWAVRTRMEAVAEESAVRDRIADERSVGLTLEELLRSAGGDRDARED